jgi:hypothetical protein
MNRTLKNLSLITLLWCVAFSGQAKQLLDRVAVIVDQGVVLESEIVELVSSVKAGAVTSGQTLPSDKKAFLPLSSETPLRLRASLMKVIAKLFVRN